MAAPNPSGLSEAHRKIARDLAVEAAVLGLKHAASLHYTQDAWLRWEGIREQLKAWKGQFPHHADCSAFVTWCLWNGLDHYHHHDNVNGLSWKAGYTGTLLTHGVRVDHRWTLHRADAVIYGSRWPGEHTALYIGGGLVISNGSEAGPYKLHEFYRPDVLQVRRYI